MTVVNQATDTIKRDHPNVSGLQSDYRELDELWSLYDAWKRQKRDLDEAAQGIVTNAPEQLSSLEALVGTSGEFKSAGQIIKTSLKAKLQEIQSHDLSMAVERREMSQSERQQIETIALQWQREAELEAMRPLHERNYERSR